MKVEAVLQILTLILRAADQMLKRSGPPAARTTRRAQKVLTRAAERAAPAPRQRPGLFGLARLAFLGAAASALAAFLLARQQRRVQQRYRPVREPFSPGLLEVMAGPDSGHRLDYDAALDVLTDPVTRAVYPIVDGIPDFLEGPPAAPEGEMPWPKALSDLLAPAGAALLGANPAGNAALAGAVAVAAGSGWALSVPGGPGLYEVEMARANPEVRILCVAEEWDALLEARRRALEAGVTNLYYARGMVQRLPVQSGAVHAVWTAYGFHRLAAPEQAMIQIARVARPGARVAGVSLVSGGPPFVDAVLRLGARLCPGARGVADHLALLAASGLRDLRAYRDGAFVRFAGLRAS